MIKKITSLVFSGLLVFSTGCNRKNNPLLNYPSGGTTSASLLIPQIDTSGSSENRIFVLVTDQSGTPITNFQMGNFSIVEGGVPGVPFEIGQVSDILYLALVIDRSLSMNGPKTTAANTAGVTLMNALSAFDYASIVDFGST